MEIIERGPFVTNIEVLRLLKEREVAAASSGAIHHLLTKTQTNLVQYLETAFRTPGGMDISRLRVFVDDVAAICPGRYGARTELSEFELFTLINLRPSSIVDMHMIVSGCDSRLTEDQCKKILDAVKQHLG